MVAEEIRKLAEEARSSTERINEIISKLQTESGEALGTITELQDMNQLQRGSADDALERMKMVYDKLSETVASVQMVD